jgi:hypothetical protein
MPHTDADRWRAEIKTAREAIRRLKLIRPQRRPGHDALARLQIDGKISEYRTLILMRERAIEQSRA